ncbi:MAG: DEAD/DEAH box helicase family protein [Sulfurovum sp.]
MIHKNIKIKKDIWLYSDNCTVKEIINYIKQKGKLRDTQIEAIEIYLFLKIKGQNKPLWQLFSEGFFTINKPLVSEEYLLGLDNGIQAFALYDFAKKNLPSLVELIRNNPSNINYDDIIKNIFYDVSYSDYLLSLPMGAGKTYLMASFIYLDLYFALNEPYNKNFAHNFLILIPSGLKNSIAPSLKSIASFDGSWVLPEIQAKKIKQLLKFDILDVPKTAKKSNLAVNPNASKVNSILPNPFGQIFVVNAEKVILNSKATGLFQEDEIVENELKQKLALIPNLTILIDEVHHAASDDIKLRQVVSWWNKQKNIITVLGFSGTPYLKSAEKIYINDIDFFKFTHITNTVYYYPLTTAIEKFLKLPTVKSANLSKTEILTQSINDFNTLYKTKIYQDGTIAKCAIYCSNIKDLEEVVYPHLLKELKIPKDEILKFHKGNKEYSVSANAELDFRSLDLSSSNKRYILLVQVGKEGWDCRSLTSVILSGTGDSPKNMVLQTSCRCLREVDKDDNTALIWLNEANAKILNDQLKKDQNSSIEELNSLGRVSLNRPIQRVSRVDYLKLPKIDFYQLKIRYTTINIEEDANTKEKLVNIVKNIDRYKEDIITIKSGSFDNIEQTRKFETKKYKKVGFIDFLFYIEKNSFMQIDTKPYKKELEAIYNKVDNLELVYNDIALSFSIKRDLSSVVENISQSAEFLIVDNLKAIEENNKLYPSVEATKQILQADKNTNFIDEFETKKQEKIIQLAKEQKFDKISKISDEKLETTTTNKDKSFQKRVYK